MSSILVTNHAAYNISQYSQVFPQNLTPWRDSNQYIVFFRQMRWPLHHPASTRSPWNKSEFLKAPKWLQLLLPLTRVVTESLPRALFEPWKSWAYGWHTILLGMYIRWYSRANPTIASNNSSTVKIHNATSSLERFENKKNLLLCKNSSSSHPAGVVAVNFKSRKIASRRQF
jgi:hypothetical protein